MDFQQVLQNLDLEALSSCDVFNETVRAALSSLVSQNLQSTPTAVLGGVASHTAGSWIRDANHTSNFTIPDGPLPTSPNQVPWQNAFWALAAIAVNTCLQDCGRVCELSKEFAILLRSSPVYCLLDSLVVIFQLCYYSIMQGPRRAVQIVSSCRDQHPIELAESNTRPIQYIMRGLILVMAILQAVKLFAMKGILWTQLFGACYLVSYVVNGIINVFAKPPDDLNEETQPLPRREHVRPSISNIHAVGILAYILQVVVWTVSLEPAVPNRLTSPPANAADFCLLPFHLLTAIIWTPLIFGWLIPFMWAPMLVDIIIFVIPVALGQLILWVEPIKDAPSLASMLGLLFAVSPDTISIICGIAIFIGSLMLRICKLQFWVVALALGAKGSEATVDWVVETAFVKMDPYLVMLTFILLAAFLSYAVARLFMFGTLAKPLRLDQHKLASNLGWSCLFLFGTNVVFAVIYYSKVYDPQHTYKPHWVENLPRALQ